MRKAELLGTGGFALMLGLMAMPRGPARSPLGLNGPAWERPNVSRDLSQILKDTLRVLVLRDREGSRRRGDAPHDVRHDATVDGGEG